jgi:hypothetical protein
MSASATLATASLTGALSLLAGNDAKPRSPSDDDASSVLSSIPPADASSELSSPDEDDQEDTPRPRKRVKPLLPTPPSTSGSDEQQRQANKQKFKVKEYLEAGLYSATYKLSPENRRRSSPNAKISTAKGKTRQAARPSPFPLPLFTGLETLETKREFQLPFDIRREFDTYFSVADGSGTVIVGAGRREYEEKVGKGRKPPPYKKIVHSQSSVDRPFDSVYQRVSDRRASLDAFPERTKYPAAPIAVCHCKKESRCRDSCLNRYVSVASIPSGGFQTDHPCQLNAIPVFPETLPVR